jgi:hypothetical protein
VKAKTIKSFLVLFFKKDQEKGLLFEKEAKTFVNCSLFDDIGWSRCSGFSNAIPLPRTRHAGGVLRTTGRRMQHAVA